MTTVQMLNANLFACRVKSIWRWLQHYNVWNRAGRYVRQQWVALGVWISQCFDCPEQPLTTIHTLSRCCGLTAISALTLVLTWHFNDPFALFTSGVFQNVGLSGQELSADALFAKFRHWSHAGQISTGITTAAFIAIAIFVHVRKTFRYVSVVTLMGVCSFFGGIFLPPFTFLFSDGFVLHPSANSTILNSDPGIVANIESAIGIGFATVAFSWYSVLFTVALLGMWAHFDCHDVVSNSQHATCLSVFYRMCSQPTKLLAKPLWGLIGFHTMQKNCGVPTKSVHRMQNVCRV